MLAQMMAWLKSGMPPYWVQIGGVILYMHLEWWLPRTSLFKANSVLEGIGNLLEKMLVDRIPLIGKLLTYMASQPKAEAVATDIAKPPPGDPNNPNVEAPK